MQSCSIFAGGIPEAYGAVCTEVTPQDCSVLCDGRRGGSLQDSGGLVSWAIATLFTIYLLSFITALSADKRHLSLALLVTLWR